MLKKVIIQKDHKYKSKKKFPIVLLFIALFITSCTVSTNKNILVEDDFRIIRAGMTTNEIEQILGKPNRIINGQQEIEKIRSNDLETVDRWANEDPDIYFKFYDGEKKMQEYYHIRKTKGFTKCYEYDYKYDRKSSDIEKWHIYFYQNKINWMRFP